MRIAELGMGKAKMEANWRSEEKGKADEFD